MKKKESKETNIEQFFPEIEFKTRYRRARELMVREGLDALVALDVSNYTYLGGHLQRPMLGSGARPFMLILPAEGEPVLVAQRLFEQLVKKTSWIKNLKLWGEFPFTVKPLTETFLALGLENGKIGVDLGGEFRQHGLSFGDFVNLKKALPNAKFVDASNLFWKLRFVKTDAEIECLRKTCDVTSQAYEDFFQTVEKKMNEKEMTGLMVSLMKERGLEGRTMVYIFPGATLISGPSDRVLKDGDTIFMDSGASYKGYTCDFGRLGVAGHPSEQQKKMYELIAEVTWKCVEMVKPGIRTCDIAKTCSDELRRAGVRDKPAGRIGHGLGLGIEPPSVGLYDDTMLEPGMIITIEPEVSSIVLKAEVASQLPEFRFVQEEDVLVTKNGYEVLSWASRGLHVI